MSVPFSRSVRSLHADGFRYALAALTISALLLLAWLLWLFNATVTDWEKSNDARVVDGEFIDAGFSSAQLRRIARGQTALFYPDAADGAEVGLSTDAGIPAVVTAVTRSSNADATGGDATGGNGDGGRVSLIIRRTRRHDARGVNTPTLADGASGRVTVAVAHRSPAALLFKAAGAASTQASNRSGSPPQPRR